GGGSRLEGEVTGDLGDYGTDVWVLVRGRGGPPPWGGPAAGAPRRGAGRGRLAVGERPQSRALDDERDRAGDVDDDRVGLGDRRRPEPRGGDRDGAGVFAPALERRHP